MLNPTTTSFSKTDFSILKKIGREESREITFISRGGVLEAITFSLRKRLNYLPYKVLLEDNFSRINAKNLILLLRERGKSFSRIDLEGSPLPSLEEIAKDLGLVLPPNF